jgi:transcription elongation factor GreB
MSRAFVKEPDDGAVGDDQPDLPQSPHPNYMTPEGLATLRRRLVALEEQRRLLSATPDDLAHRLQVVQIEREMRYLAGRIERAIPVKPASQPPDKVCFGALVTAVEPDGAVRAFQIVGEDEADAEHGKLSWVSPLPQAALGARIGDVITWRRPSGDVELEILTVRYPTSTPEG